MTKEQIAYLYKLAEIYYKNGKFGDLSRNDFKQMCALAAVERLNKHPEVANDPAFISSTVYMVSKDNVLSAANLSKQKSRWSKHTFSHVELTEALEVELQPEYTEIICDDLLRVIKTKLTPLEYKIVILMYSSNTRDEIAEKLKMSRMTISRRISDMRAKLKELQ